MQWNRTVFVALSDPSLIGDWERELCDFYSVRTIGAKPDS